MFEKCSFAQPYLNDLFEVGVPDDKLAIINDGNQMNYVTIQTPMGPTNKFEATKIVTQGGPLAPLLCAIQTDTIGKKVKENYEYMYMFKGHIHI